MKSGFPAVACPEIRGGGAAGVSRYLYGASLAEASRQEGGAGNGPRRPSRKDPGASALNFTGFTPDAPDAERRFLPRRRRYPRGTPATARSGGPPDRAFRGALSGEIRTIGQAK